MAHTLIRNTVLKLADQGKYIIPVLHSYGGVCGGQAMEGLGKGEREAKGLKGRVARLVYIMAILLPEGVQPARRGTTENMFPFMKADLEKGIVTISAEDASSIFYNDLSPSLAEKFAAELQPQSIGVFWSKVTYAPWRTISTTYVLCENDRSCTMAYAEYLLGVAKATDEYMIDTLERFDTGHFAMLSRPEWVVEVLRRAARVS